MGGRPQIVDPISKITPISDLLSSKGCLSVERPWTFGGEKKERNFCWKIEYLRSTISVGEGITISATFSAANFVAYTNDTTPSTTEARNAKYLGQPKKHATNVKSKKKTHKRNPIAIPNLRTIYICIICISSCITIVHNTTQNLQTVVIVQTRNALREHKPPPIRRIRISDFGLPDPKRDPDRHQNCINWSLSHALPLQKISSKSVHKFASNPMDSQTNRQTDKQTDKQTELKTNLLIRRR